MGNLRIEPLLEAQQAAEGSQRLPAACGRLRFIEFQTDSSCQGATSLVSADHFGMKPNRNNAALFSD
jgi:hypothetical protein